MDDFALLTRALRGNPHALELVVAEAHPEWKTVPNQSTVMGEVLFNARHEKPWAQFLLALHFTFGLGVPQDLARARHWFSLAAERGCLAVVHCLAELQILTGDAADRQQGIEMLHRVAALGDEVATEYLEYAELPAISWSVVAEGHC